MHDHPDHSDAGDAKPSSSPDEDKGRERREVLKRMAKVGAVAAPIILTLHSKNVLAASGGSLGAS